MILSELDDFTWNLQINWFKNKNTVLSLYEGVENILLSSQWDISTNIVVGKSYGQLEVPTLFILTGKEPLMPTDIT